MTDARDPERETRIPFAETRTDLLLDPRGRQPSDPTDLERDLVFARVEAGLLGASTTPARIGRFTIVDQLGRGAMGIVYRAYDPKLDRKVAIKLVDGGESGTEGAVAQARLEREARAAATLSHPNVVTVYDVGRFEDRVFLAMEFVDGSTLTQWLSEKSTGWRDTVAMFIQVARGLAAAHEYGIVHRDLKPDNVLVGSDGRARVADFGLARPVDGWESVAPEELAFVGVSTGFDPSMVRSTGGICGTPRYMAPEQYFGSDVGPAADQFSFCVALYEALFGETPYKGGTLTELATRVLENKREAVPKRRGLPLAIIETLNRGLEPDPDSRYASMAELADVLEHLVARRRRVVLASIGSGLTIAALAGGYQVAVATTEQPCERVHTPIAEAWSDDSRAAVASKNDALASSIDEYVESWVEKRRDACESTQRGEQSTTVMDVRMACLDKARMALEGVTEAVDSATEQGARRLSVDAVLPRLERCDGVQELLQQQFAYKWGPSPSEVVRSTYENQHRELSRLGTLSLVGDRRVEDLRHLAEVGATTNQPDIEGRARLWLALALFENGDPTADAEAARSLHLLIRVRRYRRAIDALRARVVNFAKLGRFDEARLGLEILEAMTTGLPAAEKSGGASQLHFARGELSFAQGRYEEARNSFRLAATTAEDAPEISALDRASALHNVALSEELGGRYAEAVASYRQTLSALAAVGSESTASAITMRTNLANALVNLGQHDEAAIEYQAALDLAAQTLETDEHPLVVAVYGNWGWMELQRGNLDEAERLQKKSLAIRIRLFGEDHPKLAYPIEELGKVALERGDLETARTNTQRAIDLRNKHLSPDHPLVAEALTWLGEVELKAGEPAKAKAHGQRALAIREREGTPPKERAHTEFVLARATLSTDPEEAKRLAEAAMWRLSESKASEKALLDRIDAWRSGALD